MSGKKQKKYKLTGLVLDLSKPLANGCIIDKDEAKRLIEEFNSDGSRRLGELGHNVRVIGTDLCNVSHAVERLRISDDKIFAEGILIEELAPGRSTAAKSLVEAGNAYFAPRILGDIEKGFDLLAVDIVPGPSMSGKEPIKHIE